MRNKEDKFELDKERLDWLTSFTNRSKPQTQMLFNLVDGDFDKLKELETKLKNTFHFACPDSLDEVNQVLSLENKSNYFQL